MTLQRLKEDLCFNQQLYTLTKFNNINSLSSRQINKIIVNFGFKNIHFDKKKFLSFLMVLELITGQKCVLTINKKKHTRFKMKKGTVVGCKVTLRKEHLYDFLDTLQLSLPRIENFKPWEISNKSLKKKSNNSFSILLKNLYIFNTAESDLTSDIKDLHITFVTNTYNNKIKKFLLTANHIPLI